MDVLQTIAAQQTIIQKQLNALQIYLTSRNIGGNGGTKYVIVGVKDISSSQLYYAYKEKGLNLDQLSQLSDGKYSPQQIYKKLSKMTGGAI